MTSRPLIAVAGAGYAVARPFGPLRLRGVPEPYVEAVRAGGGVPVVLAPTSNESCFAWLGAFGGLVLAGGDDVGADPSRDRAERGLLLAALARDLPVLGVCRGAQLVNVALGGTLVPDLDALGRPHVLPHGSHPVETAPGSVVRQLLGPAAAVNSLHHQAVDRLGHDLTATAWAADGTVEAVEGDDLVAVQWHPELQLSDGGERLFEWLVARAGDRPSCALPNPAVLGHPGVA